MLKSHKAKVINEAQHLGYVVPVDAGIKLAYEQAIEFLYNTVNIRTAETITAKYVIQHAADNVYIEYKLPERGKEWYQGALPYDSELGYIHITVDDDGKLYVITQASE